MSEEQPTADLVTMAAEIVAAYVANNALATADEGGLIGTCEGTRRSQVEGRGRAKGASASWSSTRGAG